MTRVTRTAAAVASATLAIGVLGAPARAEQPADPVSGLVGGLLGPAPAHTEPGSGSAAVTWTPDQLGQVSAPNGRLRRGCHNYRYDYAITTPTDDWTLETFLRDRDGRNLGGGTFLSDSDPETQRTSFRFCRFSTRAGLFTIRALVHWYDRDGTEHEAWLDQARFRLRPPR